MMGRNGRCLGLGDLAEVWVLVGAIGLGVMLCHARPAGWECPTALFSFGTSLSDTGNYDFVFDPLNASHCNIAPYGESYFGHPANRFSDGRLIIDFFAQAWDFPFLTSIQTTDSTPDYTHGVNFAFSGGTALPDISMPYDFSEQIRQFVTFKVKALAGALPHSYLPDSKAFDNGLYVVFFGRNDFTYAFTDSSGSTPAQVIQNLVPKLVQAIKDGIQELYQNGARSFMVFNVNPQGCHPQYMTLFGAVHRERDAHGCLSSYNRVIQVFNSQLRAAVGALRTRLTGSKILYADFYSLTNDVFNDPQYYGFDKKKMLEACCGVGGKYNWNELIRCGTTGFLDGQKVRAKACPNPSEYISWDGIHFTEAFYKIVAQKLLQGSFLDPPINIFAICNLELILLSMRIFPGGWNDH